MKKDIEFHKVQNVSVAVTRQKSEDDTYEWSVYLLNHNEFPLTNVLVTSKGYGYKDHEQQKTSVLRHLIGEIPPHGFALIEPINPDIFHLTSEYWVSYYVDEQIYDKKFIFVPDSIVEDNLVQIEQLELEGVLHQ